MIADCVRSHIAWMTLNATRCGGATGSTGSIDWAWVPGERTVHLLFPDAPRPSDLADVVDRADTLQAASVALWSAADREIAGLAGLGFERGWQPWWMAGAILQVPAPRTERARLVTDGRGPDRARAALLPDRRVLAAEARLGRARAGSAWLHLGGEVAGLYDMAVRPRYRRRGLGRDLLGVLASGAAMEGATLLTLNATPDGAALYRACGLRMLGAGRTWWRHRRR